MVWVPLVREAFGLGLCVHLAGPGLCHIPSLDSSDPALTFVIPSPVCLIDRSGSFLSLGAITMDLVTADGDIAQSQVVIRFRV